MIPLLVQPISNEESTNILPVPWIRFHRCRFHGIDRLVLCKLINLPIGRVAQGELPCAFRTRSRSSEEAVQASARKWRPDLSRKVDLSSSSDAMPPKLRPQPSKSTRLESALPPMWATFPCRRQEKQR